MLAEVFYPQAGNVEMCDPKVPVEDAMYLQQIYHTSYRNKTTYTFLI